MYVVIRKTDNAVMGTTPSPVINNDTYFTILAPPELKVAEIKMWEYGDGKLKLKQGPELERAKEEIYPRVADKVVNVHAGRLLNPRVIGHLEAAIDIVVQVLDYYVRGEKLPDQLADRWRHWFSNCAPYWKQPIDDLDAMAVAKMAAAKAEARRVKEEIEKDPEWPYKEEGNE